MYLREMIRPRVYVETTIPSAYFEVRTAATVVARREWTRKWWDVAAARYELLTSPAVLAELVAGRSERATERAALVQHLPLLVIGSPVLEIVQAYIRHKLMPADPGGDALHLALASYYKCDFLVTWNCQHLANANKFGHIRRINTLLGLYVPSLVTPLELLGAADEQPGDDERL
jgi:predicted nucleic acid-binding protein